MGSGFTLVISAMLGSILGSFYSVLVTRTVTGQTLMGRSRCASCTRVIAWYRLIPILSYVLLRGRCGHCHARIPSRLFIAEVVCAFLFALGTAVFFPSGVTVVVCAWAIVSIFFLLAYSDALIQQLSLSVLAVGLIVAFGWRLLTDPAWGSMWYSLLLGGGWFFAQWVVSRGRWIGTGDIFFGVVLGVLFPLSSLLIALWCAYITGALYAALLLARGRATKKTRIPFAVFLSFGGTFALFFGERIVRWYFSFW